MRLELVTNWFTELREQGVGGEGGMATVYLAKDLKHNRNVALKVLKPELAAVVGAERFLTEIETTANLQHPASAHPAAWPGSRTATNGMTSSTTH